jgi:hypothetical protein
MIAIAIFIISYVFPRMIELLHLHRACALAEPQISVRLCVERYLEINSTYQHT